jgi:glycosyltransferase involved in cell wall biosynthesis
MIMTGHNLMAMLAIGGKCRTKRIFAAHFHHTGVKPIWQWRLIYSIACYRFQAITFPSDFVRNEAERIYPPVKSISHTVYNPISLQQLPTDNERTCARKAFGLPLDAPVIGNAGWLIQRKRFDILLKVARLIVQRVPNSLFLIAGDGEERAKLEALSRDLNISEHVRWLGWQKNMLRFYHCLNVMLFNSDWDAVGLSPLEAICNGVPLVASVLNGGLSEILNSDDYAYLLPRHDIEALAEKTIYLLQNSQVAEKVALAGRERIAQLSNTKRIAGEIEALLLRAKPVLTSG